MSKLLQIALLGNLILRKKASIITSIDDPEIQQLIDDMISTVEDVDGVGLAAPQVYQSVRVFILASHPTPRYPDAPIIEPTAIINPQIKNHSEERIKDWEGCLSIPGIRALVPRYKQIDVEYFTRKGEKISISFEGFLARIFQHEYDHLEGIMFFDRLDSPEDIYMEKEYQRIISNTKKQFNQNPGK